MEYWRFQTSVYIKKETDRFENIQPRRLRVNKVFLEINKKIPLFKKKMSESYKLTNNK